MSHWCLAEFQCCDEFHGEPGGFSNRGQSDFLYRKAIPAVSYVDNGMAQAILHERRTLRKLLQSPTRKLEIM
jgi:hypothetical protein